MLCRAGLDIAEELAGPGSRELLTEFRRCYRENPYPERLSLFFPDYDRIIGILYQGQNYTSNRFLNTVDTVFRQFHAWPSAWPGLERLLAPEHPWSEAYCKQLIAGGYWSPFDFFTVNLDTLRPLQRYPLSELKAQSRTGFRVVERWLANLEASDPKTQALLQRFKEQDAINAKEQIMQLRPLEDLLEHLLSRVLKQVLQACENSDEALTAIVTARDRRQRTILHVTAEQGNTNLAEMFLNSVAEESRAFFATAVDAGGYTAADLATLAGFHATAEKINALGGSTQSTMRPEGLKLFPPVEGQKPTQDAGGWGEAQQGVPADWTHGSCEIDSIVASQFDWDVFEKHYVAARRPLLIRGGVRMSVSDKVKFTKEGLLDVAGSRKVWAFSTPYEGDFRDVAPVEMSLEDYTDFLDQRDLSDEIRQNFSYVFERLPDDEGPLSFARSPPKLFKDQILLRSAQFTLGGQLMGSPLHYHVDAVNSLIFGKKLWFLKPPAEQEFRKTVVYEDLVKTGGPQGLRVIQEGGDLLYVPQDWAHGALCISQCVGLAHEFDVKVQTSPVSVETVNAGLGVAVAGILVFTIGVVSWVVTHI